MITLIFITIAIDWLATPSSLEHSTNNFRAYLEILRFQSCAIWVFDGSSTSNRPGVWPVFALPAPRVFARFLNDPTSVYTIGRCVVLACSDYFKSTGVLTTSPPERQQQAATPRKKRREQRKRKRRALCRPREPFKRWAKKRSLTLKRVDIKDSFRFALSAAGQRRSDGRAAGTAASAYVRRRLSAAVGPSSRVAAENRGGGGHASFSVINVNDTIRMDAKALPRPWNAPFLEHEKRFRFFDAFRFLRRTYPYSTQSKTEIVRNALQFSSTTVVHTPSSEISFRSPREISVSSGTTPCGSRLGPLLFFFFFFVFITSYSRKFQTFLLQTTLKLLAKSKRTPIDSFYNQFWLYLFYKEWKLFSFFENRQVSSNIFYS